MSKSSLTRINDAVLGAFSHVPPSATVDHLVRVLSTWGGSDKFFALVQYTLKLVVPLLQLRARMQHRAGMSKSDTSDFAGRAGKLASVIGDARRLWSFWGILPIFQWLISLERNAQPTRRLHNIERMQGWSMLGFFPLEQLSYLISKDVVPSTLPSVKSLYDPSAKPVGVDVNRLGMLSCRFWAAYVFLQFAHMEEDRKLLIMKHRTFKRSGMTPEQKKELQASWDVLFNQFIANLAYLPMTIHYSLEKGLFKNDTWVTFFGWVAAVSQFYSAWKATALPTSKCASLPEETELDPAPLVTADIVTEKE
ncbi:hypothetical protein BD626DRAFT_455718 [Schizophyllum amplum]|uniref:Uncharacterized protein n=1 Tax=Schizophyllum amplum TaxID=97359 RepID=A0A550CHX9_9AGAR|nr:hypothetical protein BD626DRAFT_455718 [Auriculariopsis ampla]